MGLVAVIFGCCYCSIFYLVWSCSGQQQSLTSQWWKSSVGHQIYGLDFCIIYSGDIGYQYSKSVVLAWVYKLFREVEINMWSIYVENGPSCFALNLLHILCHTWSPPVQLHSLLCTMGTFPWAFSQLCTIGTAQSPPSPAMPAAPSQSHPAHREQRALWQERQGLQLPRPSGHTQMEGGLRERWGRC